MARRKTEAEKALEIFQRAAQAQGIELDTSLLAKISVEQEKQIERDVAIDGVLLTLHKPHTMMRKTCRFCNETFMTDYCSVGYCCNEHRRLDLARIGIVFDGTPNGRWGRVEPPVVIPPQVLATLQEWALRILAKSPSPNPNPAPAPEQGVLWESLSEFREPQDNGNHQQYLRPTSDVLQANLVEVLDMLDFLD